MFDNLQVYIILTIAIGYIALYEIASKLLVNKEKIKEINQRSKQLQQELSKATKEKNEKKLEEISKEYEKLMPQVMHATLMQLVPLIIVLPILSIILTYLKNNFTNFIIKLPFSLPIFIQNFNNFPNWRDTFGPVGWFWLSVIGISLVISFVRFAINKLKEKDIKSLMLINNIKK